MRTILHIDFNSYFATVEQQANPRLRGKPIGVTGGDRMARTVLGAASVEAKRFGVKTGMQIWEAKKLCPELILVKGDSDKYLECTKRFLAILKDYSPALEVFSIDECFLELSPPVIASKAKQSSQDRNPTQIASSLPLLAMTIKQRIRAEIGEWITCSIGISYNKLMAKLAGSLYKPDGLVVIEDEKAAQFILDRVELDDICGIGGRIKKRLNNMGVFNFTQLRKVPLRALLASFKSYGQILYNMARGIDYSKIMPFYEKEEVKSIGHRHTIDHDTDNPQEIKQILLKLTELVARRLRAKKLVGKTVHCWYREAVKELGAKNYELGNYSPSSTFQGDGMQTTINPTQNGLEIFKAAWGIFHQIWDGNRIRMIGVSISNLKLQNPKNLTFLEKDLRQEKILQTLDKINDRYGEFTLQRGLLLGSVTMRRKPNPFLADRRFKL
ncbi:MAG: DNA polymerase IV [Candidatus Daviesbacteria bacterium]|nr:DNA polymerase IV [Candidatus Daviesbacteria bacterium]